MRPSSLAPAVLLCASTLALASAAAQRDTAPPAEPAPWTVDDIVRAEQAGQFQVSPDGRWVVWVKSTVDPEKGRVSNLILSSLTETREVVLTRGPYTHSSPRWSPGSRTIAFLSNRPLPEPNGDAARTQLWLIDAFGGEPWPLTSLERGIRRFEWRDTTTILFLAQEDPTRGERQAKKAKDDARVVDDSLHQPPVRLFSLAVGDGAMRRLSTNDDWMDGLALSPDGRYAVTTHDRELSYAFDQKVPPVTFLWDLRADTGAQILAGGRLLPAGVRWATDGAGFYFANDSTRHPRWRVATINVLYYYDVAQGRARPVPLDWPRGLAGGGAIEPVPGGVLALLADGVHFRPARITRSGEAWTRSWITGTHVPNVFSLAASPDGGTLVYSHSTASTPTQWYRARLEGDGLAGETALTSLNAGYRRKTVPRTEVVRWRGARNDEVEGILHYPIGYEAGQRYPLVLSIHGGPSSADLNAWTQSWGEPKVLLNQRGAFVLEVNYHGSSNYGLDWVESIGNGRYYELEIPDLQAGVAYAIQRGLADPDRLATMGWSNGAILSIELVTRDQRFKAASTGAGDVEWISDWGNVDFGMSFDNYYFGAAPYENPRRYIEKSPFFRLDRVRTPTIIYFGTEDRNVPPSQGWSHYRALQQHGNTEVRFVLFPGEPHGLGQLAHQRRKVEEDLAWFDRHLFEPRPAVEALSIGLVAEAFDSTSPLGHALRAARIARVGHRYGVEHDGILVPEVVRHNGLWLGRFEVTRAQWVAFDSTYRVPPGTDNYPIAGVSYEQAQEYVRWLAARMAQPFRLGTTQELKTVYAGTGAGENTLDYWAGYALNPDDAERLARKVAELPGETPLLLEVGRFAGRAPGAGEPVFDLGGNVSEWALGASGGALLGGSADRPADRKTGNVEAGPAYRGLRVVRGP